MQAKDLIVLGSSRLLGKLYTNDISIGGNIETEGKLSVGKNTAANALIYLNSKVAFDGHDAWLRINVAKAFTSGIYFGDGIVRTDGTLQIGSSGSVLSASSSGVNIKTNTSITWAGNTTYPYALSVSGKTNLSDTLITNLSANKIDVKNIDVADELRAAKYSIETVQNLGGHFLVCPTLEFPSDTTGISSPVAFKVWVKKNSDTQLQIIIQDQQLQKSGGGAVTYEGTPWNQYSKVKVVATINNTAIPTCSGIIASWNSASSQFTLNVDVSTDITSRFTTTSTEYTSSAENMTVMLYELCSNPTATENSRIFYPIGIFLTAYGKNKYSAIDIYNGYNEKPVTRMGKLDGLPTVNGVDPTGWGFYSAKGSDSSHPGGGYFDGYLVAQNGLIGGFSIGESTLKNGTPGNDGSVFMTTNFTDTAVKIGGSSSTLSTWRFGAGSKFGVTSDGTLYCSNAYITGVLKANTGYIGGSSGWTIASQQISNGSLGSDNSMFLSTKNLAGTVGGKTFSTTTQGWRLTVGNHFGVDNTGKLYCNSAEISGAISATSFSAYDSDYKERATVNRNGFIVKDANDNIVASLSNDLTIGQVDSGKYNILVDADTGVLIKKYNTIVAQYSDTITLGQETSGSLRTKIDSDTFWITNGTNDIAFIGNENKTITDTFVSDGSTLTYDLSSTWLSGGTFSPASVTGSKVSGENKISVNSGTLPAAGETFTYTYTPSSAVTYYTMGTRHNGSAFGQNSFAEGKNVTASGLYSHAEGFVTKASGSYSHAEGYWTEALGESSHAEGYMSQAFGKQSHSEGSTKAYGINSHAEGGRSEAHAGESHAEGYYTKAYGYASHTEGYETEAHGSASHAEGYGTEASGFYSHAQNFWTYTDRTSQTVIGEFNAIDTADTTAQRNPDLVGNTNIHYGDYAFIIGNGTDDENRSNAVAVNWDGQVMAQGVSYINGGYHEFFCGDMTTQTRAINANLTNTSPISDWISALIKAVCAMYPGKSGGIFKGRLVPSANAYFEFSVYNTSTLSSGMPQYAYGTYRQYPNHLVDFWVTNYVYGQYAIKTSG